MTHTTFPRALVGAVRAKTPDQIAAQIRATLGDMNTSIRARIDGVEETVQNVIGILDGMEGIAGPANTGSAIIPVDSEYPRLFASFLRRGDDDRA